MLPRKRGLPPFPQTSTNCPSSCLRPGALKSWVSRFWALPRQRNTHALPCPSHSSSSPSHSSSSSLKGTPSWGGDVRPQGFGKDPPPSLDPFPAVQPPQRASQGLQKEEEAQGGGWVPRVPWEATGQSCRAEESLRVPDEGGLCLERTLHGHGLLLCTWA
jgi:hypothetical protein